MGTQALQEKIASNKEQIIKLLNENIDLELEVVETLNEGEFFTEDKAADGREFKIKNFKDTFKDEDTGEEIIIDRLMPVRLNNKPCDSWGREIKYFTEI